MATTRGPQRASIPRARSPLTDQSRSSCNERGRGLEDTVLPKYSLTDTLLHTLFQGAGLVLVSSEPNLTTKKILTCYCVSTVVLGEGQRSGCPAPPGSTRVTTENSSSLSLSFCPFHFHHSDIQSLPRDLVLRTGSEEGENNGPGAINAQ